MDKRDIIICISVLLLIAWFFSGFFKTTGSAVNNQKLLVDLDIPPDQQKIEAGKSLLIETSIRVPGGNIDQTSLVELEYSIKDLKGNIISAKKESGAVAVKESAVTSLLIPTNTEPGVYTAFVEVTYQEDIYEGSKTFEIVRNKTELSMLAYVLIGLILVASLIIIITKTRKKFASETNEIETDWDNLIKTSDIEVNKNIPVTMVKPDKNVGSKKSLGSLISEIKIPTVKIPPEIKIPELGFRASKRIENSYQKKEARKTANQIIEDIIKDSKVEKGGNLEGSEFKEEKTKEELDEILDEIEKKQEDDT